MSGKYRNSWNAPRQFLALNGPLSPAFILLALLIPLILLLHWFGKESSHTRGGMSAAGAIASLALSSDPQNLEKNPGLAKYFPIIPALLSAETENHTVRCPIRASVLTHRHRYVTEDSQPGPSVNGITLYGCKQR